MKSVCGHDDCQMPGKCNGFNCLATGGLPRFDRDNQEDALKYAFGLILGMIDPNASREGLAETPIRAAKAWEHWAGGYAIDPMQFFKQFADGGEDHDGMILVKDIPFYSHCEHHLAPFFGRVTIGYIPNFIDQKILGISKFDRIVDAFARRLQVQERLGRQIADCLWRGLNPIGVGVLIRARHLCMESRGVSHQGHTTVTQKLLGAMRSEPEARAEFISLAKSDVPL